MTATTSLDERLRTGVTARMFKSDFFEWFSRVHPATPFVAWVPVIAWMLYRTASRAAISPVAIVGLFLAGLLTWTLTEYTLHRFVFHWTNGTAFGKRLHFLLHGVHHDYPQDQDRLVMPPGFSVPLGVFFYLLFRATLGVDVGEAAFAGLVAGYLSYDGTHFAIHHFKMDSWVGKRLRKHHLHHHFSDPDGGYGVSSPLWDWVFRTMPRTSVEVRRDRERKAAAALTATE